MDLCFTRPGGVLYVVRAGFEELWQKLVGLDPRDSDCVRQSSCRHAVQSVPGLGNKGRGDLSFGQSCSKNGRILCINPAESLEPVVVAQLQTEGWSFLIGPVCN